MAFPALLYDVKNKDSAATAARACLIVPPNCCDSTASVRCPVKSRHLVARINSLVPSRHGADDQRSKREKL